MSSTSKKPFTSYIHDILDKANGYKKDTARIEYLKENDSFELRTIFTAAFNEHVTFSMPEGAPPYQADKTTPGEAMSTMKNVCHQFPRITAGSQLTPVQKEKIFVGMLEGVNQKDALIIIAAKDKKLTDLYPNITREVIALAFPAVLKKP